MRAPNLIKKKLSSFSFQEPNQPLNPTTSSPPKALPEATTLIFLKLFIFYFLIRLQTEL